MSQASLFRIVKRAERWSDLLQREQIIVSLAREELNSWIFGYLQKRGLAGLPALQSAHERAKKDLQELEKAILQVREELLKSVPLLRTDM